MPRRVRFGMLWSVNLASDLTLRFLPLHFAESLTDVVDGARSRQRERGPQAARSHRGERTRSESQNRAPHEEKESRAGMKNVKQLHGAPYGSTGLVLNQLGRVVS
jgi:hypothetical protein